MKNDEYKINNEESAPKANTNNETGNKTKKLNNHNSNDGVLTVNIEGIATKTDCVAGHETENKTEKPHYYNNEEVLSKNKKNTTIQIKAICNNAIENKTEEFDNCDSVALSEYDLKNYDRVAFGSAWCKSLTVDMFCTR